MEKVKSISETGIVAAAKAELRKEKVKEATNKLKALYKQRDMARKTLRNIDREIEDYLHDLELDDDNGQD